MPPEANIIARRIPIPIFGAGLVEAIADETLVGPRRSRRSRTATASAAARRASSTSAPGGRAIGRFGWKAQHATLRTFSADAYRNEMGITNELFPHEAGDRRVGGAHETVRSDAGSRRRARSPDPPGGDRQLRGVHEVSAPPPRGAIDQAARDGEQMFNAIGCAACHVPVLQTAALAPSALRPARRAALLGSAAARRRHGRRHSAGLGAAERDSHAGAVGTCAFAARSCTTAAPARPKMRSPAIAARPKASGARFEQLSTAQRRALLAFLNSL